MKPIPIKREGNAEVTKELRLEQRFPLVLSAVLLLLALILPHSVWNILLFAFLLLVGGSYFWALQLYHHLDSGRERTRSWISVGDELEERLTISNGSWMPATWIEFRDHSNIPGYRPGIASSLSWHETYTWRQSAISLQRGKFLLGPWTLISGDPFGLFQVSIRYVTTEEILIYPPITAQIPFELPIGQRSGHAIGHELVQQTTLNVSTVREYRYGDPLRAIHWPTTARQGRMIVREYDIDASGDVWIVIDLNVGNHLGHGVEGTEEETILLASAIMAQGIRENRAVGLAGYGAEPFTLYPAKGVGQQWRLLHRLALATADGELSLAAGLADLKTLIGRGNSLLVLTPQLTADLIVELREIMQRGIKVTLIDFNRSSYRSRFGEKLTDATVDRVGSDAAELLQGLKRIEIFQGDIKLPHHEQEGKPELRVTPLGRAVWSVGSS